jgi:hypothetical protein
MWSAAFEPEWSHAHRPTAVGKDASKSVQNGLTARLAPYVSGARDQSPEPPILLMAITACVRLSTPSFCRIAET